jgi:hypothetical protein
MGGVLEYDAAFFGDAIAALVVVRPFLHKSIAYPFRETQINTRPVYWLSTF